MTPVAQVRSIWRRLGEFSDTLQTVVRARKVRSPPRDGTAWRRGESRKGVHRISRSGVPCFPQLAFSARSGFPAGGIIFGSQAPEAESGRAEFVHANPHTRTSLEAGSRGGGWLHGIILFLYPSKLAVRSFVHQSACRAFLAFKLRHRSASVDV
jgi:hypothetical protein